MPLQLKANGCTDFHGNEILHVSPENSKNTLEELDKKGYRLKEAAVNFCSILGKTERQTRG